MSLAAYTLKLQDGRTLAWHEYGDARGAPCIYTTGTPASGLAGALYHAAALRAGVRWISLDKPGYGCSDFQPGRRLLDWPRDVAALADHLGLRRFSVAGESGGGPYALALAHALPQRVRMAVLIAGMGPGHEAWVRNGMNPTNRRLFWLAQQAPWLLRWAIRSLARTLTDPAQGARWMRRRLRAAPAADRQLLERMPELLPLSMSAARDALRAGADGAVQELLMLTRPWGFALADITVPVHLWHGTEDTNVPVTIARRMAGEIPDCVGHFIDGAGHGLYAHVTEMLRDVSGDAATSALSA